VSERVEHARAVGVVADQPTAVDADGVDRADRPRVLRGVVQVGEHGFLVRHRNVRPDDPERREPPDGGPEPVSRHRERHVAPVELERRERRVVHPRGQTSPNRVPDDPDDRRRRVDPRIVPPREGPLRL